MRSLSVLLLVLVACGRAQDSGRSRPDPESESAATVPTLRIATVDMQALFKDYHRTDDAREQVNLERARVQQQNNERLATIRELEAEIGKLRKMLDDPSIHDVRKQAVYRDWQIKQNEGIALDRERRDFLQRRNQALNEKMMQRMKALLEEIRLRVEELARREGYDFVLDRSGLSTSQVPLLLYSKDATDLTTALAGELNADAPVEPGMESGSGAGAENGVSDDER